jgi:hypothetical protein
VRRIVCRLGVGAAAGLLMLAAVARADAGDKAAPLDKRPGAVKDAVKGRFPGAEVTGVEKETENGNAVYDIELKHKGSKYEVEVRWDGAILVIEKEVAAKDLPEAVAKALQAKYPRAAVTEVIEVNTVKDMKEALDHYEVGLLTADDKELAVTASPDGKTIRAVADKK